MPEGTRAARRTADPTDRVLLAVLGNKFYSTVEEMAFALQRTSHTVFVNETADFSTGLATPSGELFAYPGSVGISVMVNLDLSSGIAAVPEYDEGDVIITNDPYLSGSLASHLTDTNLFKPIFVDGELIAFAWAYAHSTDVGGKVPGSLSPSSDEVFQEGVRLRPVKLYRRGELNRELLDVVLDNCRVPSDNWGDIKAIVAALNTGEQRVRELVAAYGADPVKRAMSEVLVYAEERARDLFRAVPDGSYEFSDYLDNDVVTDIPVRMKVRLTATDGRLDADFSGSDVQSASAFNIPSMDRPHPWVTFRLISFLYSMDPHIPINAGLLRGVTVTLPEGSIVNCRFPAAIGLRTTTSLRLMDALQGALATALPEVVPAAPGGAITPLVLAEPEQHSGGYRVMTLEPLVGGTGGTAAKDGVDARDVGLSNLRNNPVEIAESGSSIVVRHYGVRPDSGGPGQQRGGTGVVLEFEAGVPNTAITARGMERQRFRAWGVQGGMPGETGQAVLNPGTPRERELRKIDLLVLQPGDVVRIETPGAGGYGDPHQRPAEQVFADVLDGVVGVEAAHRDYGVVIRDGRLDLAETTRLRSSRSRRTGAFDFGPERGEHEEVWTSDLYDALFDVLYRAPVRARAYVRSRLVPAVEETVRGRPATPRDVFTAWRRLRDELGVTW